MTYQHKELAAGGWQRLTFFEQMANIGSEVERALAWRVRQQPTHARRAFERGLELVDLTLAGARSSPRLRELTRLREAMVDYFSGTNQFASSDASWRRYFSPFTFAARRDK